MHGLLTSSGALRAWWSVLMVLVVAVLVAGAGVVYTRHAQRESDRRWCELLTTLDQPGAPATTERGRLIQQQIHRLHAELGCGRSANPAG